VEALHQALTTLEERGLVQWDRLHNRYDLHPIVRAYAYGKLEDREATYAQVTNYFEALPEEDTEQARDVADLRRTLELYHALLNSGQPDDAYLLYESRLQSPLLYTLGAYTTVVELLTPLFHKGLDQPPILSTISDQASSAGILAVAFDFLGDLGQAQRLYAMGTRLWLQERDADKLSEVLCDLGGGLEDDGHLVLAESAYRVSLAVAQADDEQDRVDEAQALLIGLYATMGLWAQGEAAYSAVQTSPGEDVKIEALTSFYAARLRWGQGQDPAPLLAEALRRARDEPHLRAEKEAQRLAGEVAFARGDLSQAQEAWQAAYEIAQRQGSPLGPYLAHLARLRAQQALQETDQTPPPAEGKQDYSRLAHQLITEALRLGGRNVALAAVEVYNALGEPAEARRYVDTAYREAWADGPPYAFYHELNRIRTALKTLGLPEPLLPAFDPARVQPIPAEAEIRAFIEELKREQQEDIDEGETVAPALSNGRRPWWKFWSQN
jgi:tetratricopeptide (TPR) repeat protein